MLDSSIGDLAKRIGLFASTQLTAGLATRRTARDQRLYDEILTAIPMPGYLSSYR
jgi:hypothetical protein